MKWTWRVSLTISLLAVLVVSATQVGFASTPSEGRTSWAGFQAVELIEGMQVKQITGAALPVRLNKETEEGNLFLLTSPIPQDTSLSSLVSRYNKKLADEQVQEVAQAIESLSASYNLDPRLMASLVAVESSFNPAAVSSSGAIGLGQLKPQTAQWLGVINPYDPIDNLTGVARYLRYLLDRYNGSVPHALAAYFKGQGTIDRYGIDAGAQHYISKVNRVLTGVY